MPKELDPNLVSKAIELRKAGMPIKTIGQQLGVSKGSLKYIFIQNKITVPKEVAVANASATFTEERLKKMKAGITREVKLRANAAAAKTYQNPALKLLKSNQSKAMWAKRTPEERALMHQHKRGVDSIRSKNLMKRSNSTSIEEHCQKMASKFGGNFIDTYTNSHDWLWWECIEGHQWKAWPSSVTNGHWCPYCADEKTLVREPMCRKAIEELTGKKFPKSYPEWLISPRGNKLELDGYCEELKVAFEHQGEQHYKENKFFSNEKHNLERTQLHDSIKREGCLKMGVLLIEIPYTVNTLKIKDFIKEALQTKSP